MKLCYALRRGVFYSSAARRVRRDAASSAPRRLLEAGQVIRVRRRRDPRLQSGVTDESSARELSETADAGPVYRPASAPWADRPPNCRVCRPRASREGDPPRRRDRRRRGEHHVRHAADSPRAALARNGAASRSRRAAVGSPARPTSRRTADALRRYDQLAADIGVEISIEVHQLDRRQLDLHAPPAGPGRARQRRREPRPRQHLLALRDPEETSEKAIVALAPRSTYWHCKNLQRVHIAELNKAIYMRGAARRRRHRLPLRDLGHGGRRYTRVPGGRGHATRRPAHRRRPQRRLRPGGCSKKQFITNRDSCNLCSACYIAYRWNVSPGPHRARPWDAVCP